MKQALTAFSEEKTFFVASSVADSPLNGKTLRQCYIGGKGEALLQGRTIKSLGADVYNNYKKAQSLILQNKLINQDGTLRSGTNDVNEVFQKLLPLLINHVCGDSGDEEGGGGQQLTENDILEQASDAMEDSTENSNENESGDTTMVPVPIEGQFVRGWMSIVLFSRHIGYMWELVKELELPMVINDDYEGREKQKHGRAASRKKEGEEKKAAATNRTDNSNSTTANVLLRDRWMYAQMMNMSYEQSQVEWESGVTILGMESNALKEEIQTLQFMIAHSVDASMKREYLLQMNALLVEQRRLRQSVSSLSTKRPKYKNNLDVIPGTIIDISKGDGDNTSAMTPAKHSTNKKGDDDDNTNRTSPSSTL
jgi:hypothetical protein